MIPETGKLVPSRPPANKSVAETTIASRITIFTPLTHRGAFSEPISVCVRRARHS